MFSVARELLEMQKTSCAIKRLSTTTMTLLLMSKEIPIIAKSKKAHTTSYAPLEDIVKVVQPILSKYGFSVSFTTNQDGLDAAVTVNCSAT